MTWDTLIAKYAAELQAIYDARTAADHTFTGVLAHMLWEAQENKLRLPNDRA